MMSETEYGISPATLWIRDGEEWKVVLVWDNPTPLVVPKRNVIRGVEVEGWVKEMPFFEKILERRLQHPMCRCYIV